jgi:hypothetical protein
MKLANMKLANMPEVVTDRPTGPVERCRRRSRFHRGLSVVGALAALILPPRLAAERPQSGAIASALYAP